MVNNLSVQEIYDFIVSDFEGAWNSLADKEDIPVQAIGRGNFMFAKQAMTLLEFASRLCNRDNTGNALNSFSNALNRIDSRYFTLLPSPCGKSKDFDLPNMGDTTGRTILWAIYDLIRNGLAHQYQQAIVELKKGKRFYVSLDRGADYKTHLRVAAQSRPADHLDYKFDGSGDLSLIIFPDILFLDFKKGINDSSLLNRGLTIGHIVRGYNPNFYNFDLASIQNSLFQGKHKEL